MVGSTNTARGVGDSSVYITYLVHKGVQWHSTVGALKRKRTTMGGHLREAIEQYGST